MVKPHLAHVPDYLVPPALHRLVHPPKKRKKLASKKAKVKEARTQNLLPSFRHREERCRPTAGSSLRLCVQPLVLGMRSGAEQGA